MNQPRLSDFAKTPSFKAGTPAASKRSDIAEGIAKKNPGIGMSSKFAIATAATKKLFKKKKKA